MSWFKRKSYTSDITQLLTQLHQDRPELEAEQLHGHNLLREKKPRTPRDIAREKLARIAQQAYVYQTK